MLITRSWSNMKKYLFESLQFRARIPAANKETTEKTHATRFAIAKNLQIRLDMF